MKLLDPFAVTFSGVHLIEASAGTGKTYNISSLYIRAIIEGRWEVSEILVVTYTEAATKELRERLMKRLRESIKALEKKETSGDSFLKALQKNVDHRPEAIRRLKKAIHSFDEAAVYTIHGFCRQALQEYAFNSGALFEADFIGDDSEIIQEIVDDHWRNWVRKMSENPFKRPLLKLMLDKGYSPEKLTDELADFAGKPYLSIQPDKVSLSGYDKKLYELGEVFKSLKQDWDDRENIFTLLDAGHLSYYRTDWLRSWMQSMDEWLQTEVAPIEYFDKFSRFSQDYINQSLKKASEKEGIAPPQHPFFKIVDAYINLVQDLQDFDVAFKRGLLAHIFDKLPEKKEDLHVFSFDDLLIQLCNALGDAERGDALQQALRQAYPIALVDEFQDTDPVQYQIFRSIYAGHNETALFMIGDPKQSIYSFRGADIFAYLKAKEDASSEKTFGLGHNYRSVPPLIDGVNTLFGSHKNPFILDNISFEPVHTGLETSERLVIRDNEAVPVEIRQLSFAGDKGIINKGEAKERSAEDTAAQIQKLLVNASNGKAMIGKEPVQASDIAVLVRSHHQAAVISEALRKRGIKSVKHSRESVFHSEEAREFYRVLKAVVEPVNDRLAATALSSKILGYSANELLKIKDDESAWAAKLALFSELHDMWQDHGFSYMFRQMMQAEDIPETVIELENGERILTNLIHLSELIMKVEREENAGMHLLLKWLLRKRNEDDKQAEEEQLRLESDENLVSVVTIHHSKGLEYPVVFCPYLWDSPQNSDDGSPIVYHDPDEKSKAYLDLHGKNDPDRTRKRYLKAEEELAESVRLAYVAITRAKYKCVINWVYAKNHAHSPLGFLLLGSEESFSSLKASVDSDHAYQEDSFYMYETAFGELGNHPSIECPQISDIDREPEQFKRENAVPELEAKSFNRALPLAKGYGMASFSSLIRNKQDDFETDLLTYYDEPFTPDEESQKPSETSIFDFPKGPNPGTAIHHIFENIDFADSSGWNSVIEEQLRAQNIETRWVSVVNKMLSVTLQKPLLEDDPDFKLSAIEQRQMIAELEFYFTTGDARLSDILKIICPNKSLPAFLEGFAEEGFLKGFIDLTFEYGGRYYILDYKTNYLGDSVENYNKEKLDDEIKEAFYDVQYHLYIIALHRFLSKKKKKYRYDNYIGGVFYLFVRGLNEQGREGIFFDRPDAQLIEQLNEYLKRKS